MWSWESRSDMNIPVYNTNGDKVKDYSAPDHIFNAERHEVAEYYSVLQRLAGLRRGTASTKTKSEVRGGGRKPFRQKGTGRARQGQSTSPINPGGGITFGPKPRSYDFSLNRKFRRLALFSALSSKVGSGEIRVIEGLKIEEPKTKKALELISKNMVHKTLVIYDPSENGELGLALANTTEAIAIPYNFLNVYDILNSQRVLVTTEAADGIKEVWS